ncbi:uncharacterized protein LOC108696892 isoform X2 [Xenopus laevis]|uniref:Uncharacterized protein LOC108696892 isoform X2 n=1 Tax=Xenopus laevis TaxID=8355 RepID=A0A8J0TC94_XENLA|nr:uncharacterized protein LOC108696892 isoform X2 [Xenopus laevis]
MLIDCVRLPGLQKSSCLCYRNRFIAAEERFGEAADILSIQPAALLTQEEELQISVQDTNNIIEKILCATKDTSLEKKKFFRIKSSDEENSASDSTLESTDVIYSQLPLSHEEKSDFEKQSKMENKAIEEDIYQEEKAKLQLVVEVESKGEIQEETQNPDIIMENSLDTLDKGTSHTETGENNYQKDTLEEVLSSSDEGITESEEVVDGSEEEKNNYTNILLHSEAEGPKQMPDITEERTQTRSSDAVMLVSTGEDIKQQDHKRAKSYDTGEKKHLKDNVGNILDSAPEAIKESEVGVDKSQEEKNHDSEAEGTKQMPEITEKRAQSGSSDLVSTGEDIKQQDHEIAKSYDTGDNKHLEDNVENILNSAPEVIKESEVVDGSKVENYDTEMVLHSEAEGTKQIPDITKEKAKTRNSDSEKIVVTPGEGIKQQAIGLSYEEKMYSEKLSCTFCENLSHLVTEEGGSPEDNPIIAANKKNEENNDLEKLLYKPSKATKHQESDYKGNETHSNLEKLLSSPAMNPKYPTFVLNAIRQLIFLKNVSWIVLLYFCYQSPFMCSDGFPINSVWREYWANGTNLLAQNLKIHNWDASCSLTFNNTPQIKNCSDSSLAVLLSNTILLLVVREPPETSWYLEHGSCRECLGLSELFIAGDRFHDMESVMKTLRDYTKEFAPASLLLNSTDTAPAPGSCNHVCVGLLVGLGLMVILAVSCYVVTRRFCVRARPRDGNVSGTPQESITLNDKDVSDEDERGRQTSNGTTGNVSKQVQEKQELVMNGKVQESHVDTGESHQLSHQPSAGI